MDMWWYFSFKIHKYGNSIEDYIYKMFVVRTRMQIQCVHSYGKCKNDALARKLNANR